MLIAAGTLLPPKQNRNLCLERTVSQIYTLDPMQDRRWDALVASHPKASVFHSSGWLKALADTYGYRPIALTRTPPGERLQDGIVFCEIKSWLTGSRLVSLPFADHVEPLLSGSGEPFAFTSWMQSESRKQKWKYIELRPVSSESHSGSDLAASKSYWLHTLDLAPSLEQIFENTHKSCIRRRIRRAEQEQLSYEKGSSVELLDDFYRLLMMTRRRHRLLPQPRAWFRNLAARTGANLEIRVARKGGDPIAAMLSLSHGHTVVYKYGCSDEKLHHLAGMPYLFWKLIEESKAAGARQIDFGRSDLDKPGLIQFKDRLGANRRLITYLRYSGEASEKDEAVSERHPTRRLFSVMPDALSSRAGELVYRHFG
jgi:hypothetical protein